MALTNNLQRIVDQPVFEWCRFTPVATTALSALCSADDGLNRYMYYLVSAAFYRYDTYSDSWQLLAPPNLTPTQTLTMKYSKYSGNRGWVLAATAGSVTLAGLRGNVLQGQTIRIISGTGAGQERTITSIADAVIQDTGMATGAAAASIADSLKKWQFNQWRGYQCRLVYSTGQTQVRKILYNDATTLYFYDVNHQQIDPWNNTGFSAIAPYAAPVTTAGAQTHFVIESSVATIDTNWTTTPDATSRYVIQGGTVFALGGIAGAPWSCFQAYDILSDTWYTRSAIGGQVGAVIATDFQMDRTGEFGGAFATGTASSATARTLVNSGASYAVDRYTNYQLRITGGTGIGQKRRIVANNATTFWVARDWDVTPDGTSTYSVFGDTDKIWFVGNGNAAILQYSVEADQWNIGPMYDFGIVRNCAAALKPAAGSVPSIEPVGLASIVRTTTGITAVAVNAAGSGYTIGDLVTCSTGGTNGTAFVTSVGATGNVTGLQLAASGSGYSNGSSNTTGGTGSSLTITLTCGTTGLVTTSINHFFQVGQTVTLSGWATDTSWNADFAIIGVGSLTTFSVAAPGSAASPTVANTTSVTVIVDSSQVWGVNEHVGKLVFINTSGPSPTTQSRRIASNTATTLTVVGNLTLPVTGTSRYVINDINVFGTMHLYKQPGRGREGWATAGGATSLTDSTKTWWPSQWVNYRIRIVSGTSVGSEATITASDATSVTVASWPNGTPDTTSKYVIMDTFGIATSGGTTGLTDTTHNWPTNNLAGRRLHVTGGASVTTEIAITSNTATAITTASITATDNTSTYAVLETAARGTGVSCLWLFGLTNADLAGRQLLCARGGNNAFDVFDIPTCRWDITRFFSPQTEQAGTGSMYCYDGNDIVYFMEAANPRIFELHLDTSMVDACAGIPYGHSTAVLGNRMELINTADGLQYLYIMRHSGQEMWRVLKFW